MSTTENKAILQRAIANWNSGSLVAYLELYNADVVLHGFPPGLPPGIQGAKLFYEGLWAAFPNPRLTLDDVMAEGDKVVCRFNMQATHQGEFMGIPPTGKGVKVSGITILRFSDGKCIERWNQADMMGWLQQLGAIPTPA
ncbi:MAG: ester cyclase [Anaerolineae bacterium]|nr:ester cyclase [Anaerolineae bacterium]